MIRLPWPNKDLSPNARISWQEKARLAKKYRSAGWAAAMEAGYRSLNFDAVHLRITFHQPDKRKRDIDNMLASIKSGLDGISDAIGIDDSDWELTIRKGEVVKGGAVVVEIGPPSHSAFVAYRGHIS